MAEAAAAEDRRDASETPEAASSSSLADAAVNSSEMSGPIFAEDSNVFTLAPILSRTADKLPDDADKFDYLMAFFIAVMAEKSFRVSCLYNENNDSWDGEMTRIPTNWKSHGTNTYEIHFLLHKKEQVKCKLIAIPIGDWLVINLMPMGASRFCQTRSITVNVVKYVNMHQGELNRFWHLKELAMRFKNELLTPLHGEMLMELGVAGPSLQGVPEEVQALIMRNLDQISLQNLKETIDKFR